MPLRAVLLLLVLAAPAEAASPCDASASVWGGFPPLPRVTAALARGELRVVAIGSSSTRGIGASAPGRDYPARLEALLQRWFPGARIEVINQGESGETVETNLTRFEKDVVALSPDLVIWQVGTNDALDGVDAGTFRQGVLAGIRMTRATGADLVLLDAQPLRGAAEAAVQKLNAVLADVALSAKVVLLPRHDLMRYWLTSGQFTPTALLGPDGLHMTDASYACLAERIADLFRTARPVAAPASVLTSGR
jgi:acyl-CoA thioesterase-1